MLCKVIESDHPNATATASTASAATAAPNNGGGGGGEVEQLRRQLDASRRENKALMNEKQQLETLARSDLHSGLVVATNKMTEQRNKLLFRHNSTLITNNRAAAIADEVAVQSAATLLAAAKERGGTLVTNAGHLTALSGGGEDDKDDDRLADRMVKPQRRLLALDADGSAMTSSIAMLVKLAGPSTDSMTLSTHTCLVYVASTNSLRDVCVVAVLQSSRDVRQRSDLRSSVWKKRDKI